jgi:spore protease
MSNFRNKRTDLAIEAREIAGQQSQVAGTASDIPGVIVENFKKGEVGITRVKVISEEGEKSIGKPIGSYVTIEAQGLAGRDQDLFENASRLLAEELEKMVKIPENSVVLVVGLGNWNVTPDSLGPKAVKGLMVTRHLLELVPEQVDEGVRPVCAISPGVLGITGIETVEIVKGVVEKVKPSAVLVIDALASRKMERVSNTIQISDTGISPGSGVGNKRLEISQKSLGIPVIAIGIPTVIDAATMTSDTMDMIVDSLIKEIPTDSALYKTIKGMEGSERANVIQNALEPHVGNMIVTPREIDDIVNRMAKLVANGINMALHKGIEGDDVNRYIQ